MERHRCKLCSKAFESGRGLGLHMKVHLANVPRPPKTERKQQMGYHRESTPSSSYFSSGEEDECEGEEKRKEKRKEKTLVYALRENHKKSFRLEVDGVVQDRESETEAQNTTCRRTDKKHEKPVNQDMELKKPRLEKGSSSEPPSEPEPVSSVSYSSPEEDVAMCLMMLSRDTWTRNIEVHDHRVEPHLSEKKKRKRPKDDTKPRKIRGKHQCENCRKTFRSSRALSSHKRICFPVETRAGNINERIFECPFCFQLFGSGQALGGHKRSHFIGLSSTNSSKPEKTRETFFDLNLPAPGEEDDFSVVSES